MSAQIGRRRLLLLLQEAPVLNRCDLMKLLRRVSSVDNSKPNFTNSPCPWGISRGEILDRNEDAQGIG